MTRLGIDIGKLRRSENLARAWHLLSRSGSILRRFLARVLRFLRFSRTQIRGGHKLIKRGEVYYVPIWLPIAFALLLASTVFWGDVAGLLQRGTATAIDLISGSTDAEIAAFFSPSVRHWSRDIGRWAEEHEVDAHLLATVMQIESCGHPSVISNAGARGLFQVMPFHFADGEDMLDPETNAMRGSAFLRHCRAASDGVIGLTLACYNGGPSVINQPRERWSAETRKYYRWGVGIYSDAVARKGRSETLDQWLAAGGERLCASAVAELNR
ncbi:MAG: lytic transglycosylase domain-containing protein [Chloroflexi bacterium]|nr:lytic transglycosylase domain-containing protein [Chloroflexota bacterium]